MKSGFGPALFYSLILAHACANICRANLTLVCVHHAVSVAYSVWVPGVFDVLITSLYAELIVRRAIVRANAYLALPLSVSRRLL